MLTQVKIEIHKVYFETAINSDTACYLSAIYLCYYNLSFNTQAGLLSPEDHRKLSKSRSELSPIVKLVEQLNSNEKVKQNCVNKSD